MKNCQKSNKSPNLVILVLLKCSQNCLTDFQLCFISEKNHLYLLLHFVLNWSLDILSILLNSHSQSQHKDHLLFSYVSLSFSFTQTPPGTHFLLIFLTLPQYALPLSLSLSLSLSHTHLQFLYKILFLNHSFTFFCWLTLWLNRFSQNCLFIAPIMDIGKVNREAAIETRDSRNSNPIG